MDQTDHTIERELGKINEKVTSILTLLKGNELDKSDKGMTGVQNDHDERLIKLEDFQKKVIWVTIGMGIPASWGLIDIIQKIILKH